MLIYLFITYLVAISSAPILLHTQAGSYPFIHIHNSTTIYLTNPFFNSFHIPSRTFAFTNNLLSVNSFSMSQSSLSLLYCNGTRATSALYNGTAYEVKQSASSNCVMPCLSADGLTAYLAQNNAINIFQRGSETDNFSFNGNYPSINNRNINSVECSRIGTVLLSYEYGVANVDVRLQNYLVSGSIVFTLSTIGIVKQIKLNYNYNLAYICTDSGIIIFDLPQNQSQILTPLISYQSITFTANQSYIVACQQGSNLNFFQNTVFVESVVQACSYLDINQQYLVVGTSAGVYFYCRWLVYQTFCVQQCPERTRQVGLSCQNCFWDEIAQKCLDECAQGEYVQLVDNTCQPCKTECQSCRQQSNIICTSCIDGLFLYEGQCQTDCPSSLSKNPISKECEVCSNWFYVTLQVCLEYCPLLTFQSGNQCKDCQYPCTDCRSTTYCLTCRNAMVLLSATCLAKCPISYFKNDLNVCLPCSQSCISCIDSHTCLSCQEGRFITNGQCSRYCQYCSFTHKVSGFHSLFSDKVIILSWNWVTSASIIIEGLTITTEHEYVIIINQAQQLQIMWECTSSFNSTSNQIQVEVMAGLTSVRFVTQVSFQCMDKSTSLGVNSLEPIEIAIVELKNASYLYTFVLQLLIPGAMPSLSTYYHQLTLPVPITDIIWIGTSPYFFQNDCILYCSLVLSGLSILSSILIIFLITHQTEFSLPPQFLTVSLMVGDYVQTAMLEMMVVLVNQQWRHGEYQVYQTLPFVVWPLGYLLVRDWRLKMMLRMELPSIHHWTLFPQFAASLAILKVKPISTALNERKLSFYSSQTYFLLIGSNICIINSNLFESWQVALCLGLLPCLLSILLILYIQPFKDLPFMCFTISKYVLIALMLCCLVFLERTGQDAVSGSGGEIKVALLIWSVVVLFGLNAGLTIGVVVYVLMFVVQKDFKPTIIGEMKRWYIKMLIQQKQLHKKQVKLMIIQGNLNNICIQSLPDIQTQIITISLTSMEIKRTMAIRFNDASTFHKVNFNKKQRRYKATADEAQRIGECVSRLKRENEEIEMEVEEIGVCQSIRQRECELGKEIKLSADRMYLKGGGKVVWLVKVAAELNEIFFT